MYPKYYLLMITMPYEKGVGFKKGSKMLRKLILSLLFLCFSGISLAGGPDNCSCDKGDQWNEHSGPYIEVGAGTNAYYALTPVGNGGGYNGFGVGGAIGYYFFRTVAIEGGFMYSTKLNAAVERSIVGITVSASAAAKLYIPYLAFRFAAPIGDRFAVIFKLGAMYPFGTVDLSAGIDGLSVQGRIANEKLLPFSGIGATYAVTKQWEINFMYQGAIYILGSGGVMSLGVTYHF